MTALPVRCFFACVLSACASPEAGGIAKRATAKPRAHAALSSREIDRALEDLRREEKELRARTDFAELSPSSRAFGANPYALVELSDVPGEERFAGVLRGDSAVVVLDAGGRELSRRETVRSPNAVAVGPGQRLFVTGDIEPRVGVYRASDMGLAPDGEIPIPEAVSLRAVAADERGVFIADFGRDLLYMVEAEPSGARELPTRPLCRGPIRLALTERFLGVACLFEHSLAIFRRENGFVAEEVERIAHDGPIWSLSLVERGADLFIAAGGVEDRPLDRRDKAFGYVDSFAYLYRLDTTRRVVERSFALNTSEFEVVTPKITHLAPSPRGVELTVVGYASAPWLEMAWNDGSWSEPSGPYTRAHAAGVPGCSDVAFAGRSMLCANPLLDAWVVLRGGVHEKVPRNAPVISPVRARVASGPSVSERLGEALFFTTLMSPDATSAERRSRFTCETCHFEGATDGRVHHSGRGGVRVSTRPLLGLFNAAPYFSRAHDPDLTAVSHNEFRVANRGNPLDPWFSLSSSRFSWLKELGVSGTTLSPLELRRALVAFLARFSHAENPLAARRSPPGRFSDDERLGAATFRERCARCHAARLIAGDASTEVPFESWEELVLSPAGAIVWSNGDYAKTGVTPYVDSRGTRVPSLRRLYLKRPYLTDGSSATLDAVLSAARFSDDEFSHAGSLDGGRALTDHERLGLLAFLRIL